MLWLRVLLLQAAARPAAAGKPPSPPLPLVVACSVPGMQFCDRSLPIAARAADLVGLLTLPEKIAQLSTYSFAKKYSHRFTPPVPRIGLPGYSYHTEGLHGIRDAYVAGGINATMYPQVTAADAPICSAPSHFGRIFNGKGKATPAD